MVKQSNSIQTIVTDWQTDQTRLKAIRQQVFIDEQDVPVDLEWDGLDNDALHLLAYAEQNDSQSNSLEQISALQTDDVQGSEKLAIGTARIIIKNEQAMIGRMAVLPAWRGQGVGAQLLKTAIDTCQAQGVKQITLNAQTSVIGFYQRVGFVIASDEFMDAGIPHKKMTLNLSSLSGPGD